MCHHPDPPAPPHILAARETSPRSYVSQGEAGCGPVHHLNCVWGGPDGSAATEKASHLHSSNVTIKICGSNVTPSRAPLWWGSHAPPPLCVGRAGWLSCHRAASHLHSSNVTIRTGGLKSPSKKCGSASSASSSAPRRLHRPSGNQTCAVLTPLFTSRRERASHVAR